MSTRENIRLIARASLSLIIDTVTDILFHLTLPLSSNKLISYLLVNHFTLFICVHSKVPMKNITKLSLISFMVLKRISLHIRFRMTSFFTSYMI